MISKLENTKNNNDTTDIDNIVHNITDMYIQSAKTNNSRNFNQE